jgi:hypothetical protein
MFRAYCVNRSSALPSIAAGDILDGRFPFATLRSRSRSPGHLDVEAVNRAGAKM